MRLQALLPLLFAVIASPAWADGTYIVGEVTHSNLSLDTATFNQDLTAAGAAGLGSKGDGSGNQWRLQAGYQFNPYVAIEAGYIDMGKADYKASYAGGNAEGSVKAGGLDLAVLGIYPVTDKFSIFGKLGLIEAKVQSKLSSGPQAGVIVKDTTTQARPLLGIGASYQVLENVDLRADYDHVSDLGSASKGGKADADMVSAGLAYHF